jgi:hypothetical protein
MASPRKAKKVEQAPEVAMVTLQDLIDATQRGEVLYTSPEFHEALIATGVAEINPAMVDVHGNIATRAILKDPDTPKMEDTPVTQPTQKPVFEIKTASELPKVVRKSSGNRQGRTPIYPFADLEVSQYFFVPNGEDGKSKAKALASTVATWNSRYAEVIEGETRKNRKGAIVPATRQTRKFKIFDTTEVVDGVEVAGAKIFRVE